MKYTLTLLILCLTSLLLAEDFDSFLKEFFKDSSFQKTHIIYPLSGHYTYPCDSEPSGTCLKDTVYANNQDEWTYLGYGYGTAPNVTYKKSLKCPKNIPNENECIYIELSEKETCYNLQLYFKKNNNSWKLIYMWDFVL